MERMQDSTTTTKEVEQVFTWRIADGAASLGYHVPMEILVDSLIQNEGDSQTRPDGLFY